MAMLNYFHCITWLKMQNKWNCVKFSWNFSQLFFLKGSYLNPVVSKTTRKHNITWKQLNFIDSIVFRAEMNKLQQSRPFWHAEFEYTDLQCELSLDIYGFFFSAKVIGFTVKLARAWERAYCQAELITPEEPERRPTYKPARSHFYLTLLAEQPQQRSDQRGFSLRRPLRTVEVWAFMVLHCLLLWNVLL